MPSEAPLVLSWQEGDGNRQLTLGEDPGALSVRLGPEERYPMALPEGHVLLLERTRSELWWASIEGPHAATFTADGGGLQHAQALGQGSILELGELRVAVFVGSYEVQGQPAPVSKLLPFDREEGDDATLDVDPPPDAGTKNAGDGDASGVADREAGRPHAESGAPPTLLDPPGFANPAAPPGAPVDDDRLMYNLSAPRDELLAASGLVPTPYPADRQADKALPRPNPPHHAVAQEAGQPWIDDGVSRTPATALPRAPGPEDVWVLQLEHRHGASTDTMTLLHPPTTNGYLVVGRDPDCAVSITDAEVAPVQVGIQLQQKGVVVHPHPGTELPVVVDGRVAHRAQSMALGGIVSFGRHALRITGSKVMRAVDAPAGALSPRLVYRAAGMTLVWRVERPGRRPHTQHLKVQADLGRAPHLVIGTREPATWVLPGMGAEVDRLEIEANARGDLFIQPVGGRMLLDAELVADRSPLRRGQTVEVGGVLLTLLEVDVRSAARPAWLPTASPLDRNVWVEAAQFPNHEGRVLVLDLRAKHPSGKEERVAVDAPIGWGAACITIGRDPECDLVLHVPTVSRQHAAIRFTGGGLSLRDLSGRDSLWVNNRPVQTDTALIKGDAVTMGDARFDIMGTSYRGPTQPTVRRRVRLTVVLQISGEDGPELFRVDRVIWSDRAAQLRLGAHPSSDVTVVGAPMSLGRLEVAQRGVVFVDGTGQGGRFYGGRSFERAVEMVEGDAVEVGGVLVRFVGASVVDLDT